MVADPDDPELLSWLCLTLTPGIGPDTFRRRLQTWGSAQAAWQAERRAPRDAALIPADTQAAPRASSPEAVLALARQALRWRAEAPEQRHLLTWADADYPAALLQTADPPPLLYGLGDLARLRQPTVAMVGSRGATPQGLDHARHFGRALSQAGVAVVSGLALGIDGAAHEGALDGPGSTIAVVGTGLDRVYPRRHLALARRIADSGLLLSELALGTPSLPANFPRRNRIIAGLSLGTLVVEAALRSGSLITARLANEAGRDVFALPGSILSAQSRGCHQLIKEGAALVEEPSDILQALQGTEPRLVAAASMPKPQAPAASVPEPAADPVLDALGHAPMTLDALLNRCGWPTDQLLAHLLQLELDGQVARLPGGLLQRRSAA